MYRRRRIVALILLVLVLALLTLIGYGAVKAVQAIDYQIHKGDINAVSRAAAPDPAKSSGVEDCGKGDVSLTLENTAGVVASGGTIDFTATIAYDRKGATSCLIDASDASRVLVITSGDQTVWESDACAADPRQLLLAQGDKDTQTITWNTVNSGTACASEGSHPYAGAGTYQAQLTLKGVEGVTSQKVVFQVQ